MATGTSTAPCRGGRPETSTFTTYVPFGYVGPFVGAMDGNDVGRAVGEAEGREGSPVGSGVESVMMLTTKWGSGSTVLFNTGVSTAEVTGVAVDCASTMTRVDW